MNELDKLRGMLLDSGTEFLDHWIEQREVSEWRKLAEGGVVPESCIRIEEEGSICPAPKVNVTFEGQKLTFDAAESKEFLQLVSAHFRRLAGIEVPS